MAKTFVKQAMSLRIPSDAFLGFASMSELEGSTQTFVSSAPLVITSGYLVEAADPATAIAGFSLEAGHNITAGTQLVKFLPAVHGLQINANFLGSAAADNVLAATDYGLAVRIAKSATLVGGATAGWYFEDTGSTQAAKIISFESDQIVPNQSQTRAVAGDTNARLRGVVLTSIVSWLT